MVVSHGIKVPSNINPTSSYIYPKYSKMIYNILQPHIRSFLWNVVFTTRIYLKVVSRVQEDHDQPRHDFRVMEVNDRFQFCDWTENLEKQGMGTENAICMMCISK